MLLAAIGVVYLLASLDVRRFSSIIPVGIGVQLALALTLFAAAQGPLLGSLLIRPIIAMMTVVPWHCNLG